MLGRIALGVVAVLVALGALEAVVLLTGVSPPVPGEYGGMVADRLIPYKPRPLSQITERAVSGEFTVLYVHNSLGFRDREHGFAKPADVFRIVAVGDSFTYGVGTPFEDTYLATLERLLNARPVRRRRVEVVKLGLPRYYPGAELLVLEHYGLRYAPDLVLAAVLPNDVIDTYLGLEALRVTDSGFLVSSGAFGRIGEQLALHSHLARLVLGRWTALTSQWRKPVRGDEVFRDGGFHEGDWQQMEIDLGRMAKMAQAAGARFVLVSVPQQGPWTAHHQYPDQRLARWAKAHDTIFVPTLPSMQAASTEPPLYWSQDGHCTSSGYAVIAQAILAELTRHQVVP